MAKPECRTMIGLLSQKSNKPTKTKKAMKTKKFLSMVALALVGAMTVSCSSDDNITDQPQQPVNKNNVVTLTTTVGFVDDGTTRALASGGVKTFAEGDQIAVIYKNASDETIKTVSTISSGAGTKTATFTVALTNPDNTKAIRYIYPAAMAKATIATNATIDDDGTVDFTKLNSQTGSLTTLGNNLDLCTLDAANWTSGTLPTGTLENKLAILAITLKNEAGTSDITSGTTKLTVSDGTNTYNVNRSAAEGPIYVAILPTTSANISIEATSGGQGYYKTLTTKTYAANNGYSVSWRMTPATLLSTIASDYTAQNGETLYGKLGSNVKISIADGATVTLKDVTINGVNNYSYQWAGITCAGDAIITLEGTNTVKGFYGRYPGIYVPEDKTLTIEGEGSLNASGNGRSTGIGGGFYRHCGNIVINGGNITATGGNYNAGIGGGEGEEGDSYRCGSITINGGTVTATGGDGAAGIGCGYYGASNDITITGGTVTATGGDCAAGIGSSEGGSCGAITISGGTVEATGGENGAGIGSGDHGSCGAITISGGTVTATGGRWSAGIGGGNENGASGDITITSGVTHVTATKGSDWLDSIGKGDGGEFITVTIEDYDKVTQN